MPIYDVQSVKDRPQFKAIQKEARIFLCRNFNGLICNGMSSHNFMEKMRSFP
jgi:hypothetical protein